MVKPGVVLRRPVGSNSRFTEDAKLPRDLPVEKVKASTEHRTPTKSRPPKLDDKAARAAALAFEREQKRREAARRKEEARREKERKRREQAIAKAERALEVARRKHEAIAKKIDHDRAVLDRRSKAEDARWEKAGGETRRRS
jgi:colicin import membrane protein